MSPADASSRPAISRNAVLLPQPDGPTRTRNSLSWIWIVRSLTARTSPNTLLTWSRVTPAIGNSSTRNRSRAVVDDRAPVVVPMWQQRVWSITQTELAVQPFSNLDVAVVLDAVRRRVRAGVVHHEVASAGSIEQVRLHRGRLAEILGDG